MEQKSFYTVKEGRGVTPDFEPGDLVRHPTRKDWGTGQVQSVVNGKITVNFEHAGKVVILSQFVALEHFEKPS